jgi:hypothetical protein
MKTIRQLQTSVDSLSKALTTRKTQFKQTLGKSRFFKFERKAARFKDTIITPYDSIRRLTKPQNLKVIQSLDSIYEAMDVPEKTKVMTAAMESTESLRAYIESNKNDIYERGKIINKHYIAWHEKFTLSIACLIFFFIGAPLGAIIRKGGFGLPFIVSIIFFILYYVISVMGKKFVEEGVLPAWQGMWLSSMLTLPLGVLFTYKATTDSVLFDPNSYIEFFKRPFKVLEINYKDPTVIFHRDVDIPDNNVIFEKIKLLEHKISVLTIELKDILRSNKKLFIRHFKKERSGLISFIENYNSLYDILSVKFRNNKFERANLEKFPKIEISKYELTNLKLKSNYLLLTLGIFPIGLLVLLNSNLKIRVLKQKLEMVKNQLASFESIL